MQGRELPKTFQRLLSEHARTRPEHPFLVTHDRRLTYLEVHELSNSVAHSLRDAGVERGDRVAIMCQSGIDFVLAWFGICKLGALAVPFNEAYLGDMLRNQASEVACRIAIVDEQYASRWEAVAEDLPEFETMYVRGEILAQSDGCQVREFAELFQSSAHDLEEVSDYTDAMAILFTSGTTGPSKGVLYGYGQAYANAAPLAKHMNEHDVFYMFLPMFHTGLPHCLGAALIAGATFAVRPKFSRTQFWKDVDYFGATVTLLISAMPNFLLSNPVQKGEDSNTLDRVFMTPLPQRMNEFIQRFGCRLATLYNMTEASTPFISDFNVQDPKTCGKLREGMAAKLVDEFDEEVGVGEVGELVLRSDRPWEMNLGYWRRPDATVEAWRNQWLHTGDLLTRDAEGNFYFKDRKKDVIRRRGENISAYELEQSVLSYAGVAEVAAIPVPSDIGDEEAMIVLRSDDGYVVDPNSLHKFLTTRLPAYMVPRFIRVQDEDLPRTPTGKVQKAALKGAGTAEAWDAEGVGANA